MLTQSGHATVDGEFQAGAPAQTFGYRAVTGQGLDGEVGEACVDIELRDAGELFAHDVGLEAALRVETRVLPVAAPTQARPGERARRRHPIR